MKYRGKTKDLEFNDLPRSIQENPWEVRERQINSLVSDYMQNFIFSQTWHEAVSGKWDLDLSRYVREVARVQAKMIVAPDRDIGWDGQAIFGSTEQITDALRKGFFGDCRRQAQQGFIDVGIPMGMIEKWKKNAIPASIPPATRLPINVAPMPESKTPLDEEIERQKLIQKNVVAKNIKIPAMQAIQ